MIELCEHLRHTQTVCRNGGLACNMFSVHNQHIDNMLRTMNSADMEDQRFGHAMAMAYLKDYDRNGST